MPVHLFFGADRFARLEAVASLRDSLDDDGALANNTVRFEGKGLRLSDLDAAVSASPFLGGVRMVRVDGLCTRFDGRAGAGARRLGEWDQLDDLLRRVPPTTTLVLVDDEVGRRNPIREVVAAADDAEVREFSPLKDREATEWLRERVKSRRLRLTQGVAKALVERAAGDTGVLTQALDKLELYADGAQISEADVERLVPSVRRATIFNLVDAVAEGRLADAMRLLDLVRGEGEPPQRIMQMIARQMRQIIIAREVLDQGGDEPQLREALNINFDWLARRIRRQAQRYTQARADASLARILEADTAIQDYRADNGGMPDDLAVELLVADLARPAPRPSGRRQSGQSAPSRGGRRTRSSVSA